METNDMNEDRVKLAEAMGWTHRINELWKPPHGSWSEALPDPFTDAKDCGALIRWLNGQGVQVNVSHLLDGRAERGEECVYVGNLFEMVPIVSLGLPVDDEIGIGHWATVPRRQQE